MKESGNAKHILSTCTVAQASACLMQLMCRSCEQDYEFQGVSCFKRCHVRVVVVLDVAVVVVDDDFVDVVVVHVQEPKRNSGQQLVLLNARICKCC